MLSIALGVWSSIVNIVTAIVGFVFKYPIQVLLVVVALFAVHYSNKWTTSRVTASVTKELTTKYEKQISTYKKEAEDRETRIKEIEESSKKAAADAKTEIAAKSAEVERVGSEYEAKLEQTRKDKKIEYVYVKVPGTVDETQLILEDGQVACRRLPNAFGDTINNIVNVANKKVKS